MGKMRGANAAPRCAFKRCGIVAFDIVAGEKNADQREPRGGPERIGLARESGEFFRYDLVPKRGGQRSDHFIELRMDRLCDPVVIHVFMRSGSRYDGRDQAWSSAQRFAI